MLVTCPIVQWCWNSSYCILWGRKSSQRPPWDKGTLVPLSHVVPPQPQWIYSDLHQQSLAQNWGDSSQALRALLSLPTPRLDLLSGLPAFCPVLLRFPTLPCLEKPSHQAAVYLPTSAPLLCPASMDAQHLPISASASLVPAATTCLMAHLQQLCLGSMQASGAAWAEEWAVRVLVCCSPTIKLKSFSDSMCVFLWLSCSHKDFDF